jgi:hypothetical protein
VILAVIAHEDFEIKASDVGNAYLESKTNKDLWENREKRTVKLMKAIYGLKLAGELWNKLFNKFLVENGSSRCTADVCLYTKVENGERTYLML